MKKATSVAGLFIALLFCAPAGYAQTTDQNERPVLHEDRDIEDPNHKPPPPPPPLGFEDAEIKAFNLYPNPCHNRINIQWNGEPQREIEIFNIAGNRVMKEETFSGTMVLDVSELPVGVYLLKAGNAVYKFVKE